MTAVRAALRRAGVPVVDEEDVEPVVVRILELVGGRFARCPCGGVALEGHGQCERGHDAREILDLLAMADEWASSGLDSCGVPLYCDDFWRDAREAGVPLAERRPRSRVEIRAAFLAALVEMRLPEIAPPTPDGFDFVGQWECFLGVYRVTVPSASLDGWRVVGTGHTEAGPFALVVRA